MARIREWFLLWFTFERSVSRRAYLLSGLALMPIKYAGDVLIVWVATGRVWQPFD